MNIKLHTTLSAFLALAVSGVGLTQEVDQISILPVVVDSVIDLEGEPSDFDGRPDVFTEPGFAPIILFSPGFIDARLVLEFDLSTIPNQHIRRAVLRIVPVGRALPSGFDNIPIEVRSYFANGVLNLGDFHRGQFATVFNNASLEFPVPFTVDVTRSVRNAVANQKQFLGFVFRTNMETQLSVGPFAGEPPPRLVVTVE